MQNDLSSSNKKILKSLTFKFIGLNKVNMSKEVISLKTKLSLEVVQMCIDELLAIDYIKLSNLVTDENDKHYELTAKGKIYLEEMKNERNSFIFKSIIIPIFVSVITTTILQLLL